MLTTSHALIGAPLKAALGDRFSLAIFAAANGAIDLQPAAVMLAGAPLELHGWSHSWTGAVLIALAIATCKQQIGRMVGAIISWPVAIGSALAGTMLHVLGDALVHPDVLDGALLTGVSMLAYDIALTALGLAGLAVVAHRNRTSLTANH